MIELTAFEWVAVTMSVAVMAIFWLYLTARAVAEAICHTIFKLRMSLLVEKMKQEEKQDGKTTESK